MKTKVTTLAALQKECQRWCKEKGWEDDRTVGDLLLLMVTEIAEAYEEYRNHHEPTEIYFNYDIHDHKIDKPEGIPIELADAVIRILSFCARFDIDLEAAVLQKMAYNETRPFRHGGKRV